MKIENSIFRFILPSQNLKYDRQGISISIDISLIMESFFSNEYRSIRIDKESTINFFFFLNNKLRINIFRHIQYLIIIRIL